MAQTFLQEAAHTQCFLRGRVTYSDSRQLITRYPIKSQPAMPPPNGKLSKPAVHVQQAKILPGMKKG